MYNNNFITLTLRDQSARICTPLSDLKAELDDKGLLLSSIKKNKTLGYLKDLYGIDLDEFLTLLGFEKKETAI